MGCSWGNPHVWGKLLLPYMWGYKGELRSNVGVQRKSKVEQSKDLSSTLPPTPSNAHGSSLCQFRPVAEAHAASLQPLPIPGPLEETWEALCHQLPLSLSPGWSWAFSIREVCHYEMMKLLVLFIWPHRNDQAMPYGWLMLYRSAQELMKTSLRGDKSFIGKVGTRCEEAEVWRSSWQKYMRMWSISKCMVNLPRFGLFDWVPGCCTVLCTGDVGTNVGHPNVASTTYRYTVALSEILHRSYKKCSCVCISFNINM